VDEEFAHDGGEGDFVGFTVGAQTLVDGLEDGVAARGTEGRHVERMTHFAAPAADGAGAAERTAVAIERGEAGQGGDFVFGQRPQFRQGGEQGRGGEGADALDCDEPGDLGAQGRGAFHDFGDAGQELFNLAIEMAQMEPQGGQGFGVGGLLEAVFFPGAVLDQLGAAGDEIVEQRHLRLGLRGGRGLHRAAVIGQKKSVDPVGLGQLAAGAGEVTRQPWVDHAHPHARLVQRGDQRLVVRPGGFADDVDRRRAAAQDLHQGSMTGGVIGDGGGNGEMGTTQIDGKLGDIGTEVDRRGEHG